MTWGHKHIMGAATWKERVYDLNRSARVLQAMHWYGLRQGQADDRDLLDIIMAMERLHTEPFFCYYGRKSIGLFLSLPGRGYKAEKESHMATGDRSLMIQRINRDKREMGFGK